MEIKCTYKLASEYGERLEELGFEIPGPFLVRDYEPETIKLVHYFDDMDNLPEMLEVFIELVEKGAIVSDIEEAAIKRILESLCKLRELKEKYESIT